MVGKAAVMNYGGYGRFVKRTEAIDGAAPKKGTALVNSYAALDLFAYSDAMADVVMDETAGHRRMRSRAYDFAGVVADFQTVPRLDCAPMIATHIALKGRQVPASVRHDKVDLPLTAPLSWLLSRMVTSVFFALSVLSSYLTVLTVVNGETVQALPYAFAAALLLLLGVISILVRERARGVWRSHKKDMGMSLSGHL